MKWDCKPAKYCRIWKNKNTQIKCLAFNKSILVVILCLKTFLATRSKENPKARVEMYGMRYKGNSNYYYFY